MRPRLLIVLLSWLLVTHAQSRAGEVIAHPSVSLDAEEIRELFLGEKQFAGPLKLVPVDNSAIQREFLSKILQTDLRTYAARWTKKSFREGLVAPDVKGSDAEVSAFVRATPGSVGYVGGTATGVKVLLKF
jgi:ABC-type phosphate transport system substrate-binding protein